MIINNLNDYLFDKVKNLNYDYDTKSYIVSIFDKFKKSDFDYSKNSLTCIYARANETNNFIIFQNLGDWLFFCSVIFPEHLKNASEEYYISLGQMSYYNCYKLINKQWKLYEKLADDFSTLTEQTREVILEF